MIVVGRVTPTPCRLLRSPWVASCGAGSPHPQRMERGYLSPPAHPHRNDEAVPPLHFFKMGRGLGGGATLPAAITPMNSVIAGSVASDPSIASVPPTMRSALAMGRACNLPLFFSVTLAHPNCSLWS